VAIGIGLQLIGVPSAPLWGLVAMILRFVPYIGAFISAIFPLILAAAVGSGWEMLLLTVVLFVVLELLAGQVLEPVIIGHSSGLSPVAIIVAASFWTWLWVPSDWCSRRRSPSVLWSWGVTLTGCSFSTSCWAISRR